MKSYTKKFANFVCALLLFGSHSICQAQDSVEIAPKSPKWLLSAAVSPLAYKGDLGKNYSQWDRGFWLMIEKMPSMDKKLSLQVQIGRGRISGSDAFFTPNLNTESNVAPNRYFQTTLTNLQIGLNYAIVVQPTWNVRAGAGIGLLNFVPQNSQGRLVEQSQTRFFLEDYAQTTLMLPLEINSTYFFSNQMTVGMSIGLLNPMTKYLDNIAQLGNNRRDNVLRASFQFGIPF
jgi:hypothetical protein